MTANQRRFLDALPPSSDGEPSTQTLVAAYRAAYPNARGEDDRLGERARALLHKLNPPAPAAAEPPPETPPEREQPPAEAAPSHTLEVERILESLFAIAEGECTVMEADKSGVERPRRPTIAEQIKALELLGRQYGLFSDRLPGDLQTSRWFKPQETGAAADGETP